MASSPQRSRASWEASQPSFSQEGGETLSPSWMSGGGNPPNSASTTNATDGQEDSFDVVIVGAGISGLACADALLELVPGRKVLVLEGSERVGGRTKTIDVDLEQAVRSDGEKVSDPEAPGTTKRMRVDAGGMWLGPTQKNMLRLCERFGIETVPQRYWEGKHVLARGPANTRAAYKGDIPPYSYLSLIELQFFLLNRVDSLMMYVPIDEPEKCPYAKQWDSTSVGSFLTNSAWTSGAKEAAELICWSLLGCQATQVSMLYFLWFCRVCGGLKMLVDTAGRSSRAL